MHAVLRLLIVGAICCSPSLSPAQESGEKSQRPALIATVGDLQALIDQMGAFTGSVDPSMSAENLRASGAQFGDPGFQSFAKGAGLVFVAETPERMLVVLESKGEASAAYRGVLGAFGFSEQNEATEGAPIIAANAPGLIDSATQAAALAALAGASESNVQLEVDVAQLYKQYGPRLKLMAGSIPSLVPSAGPELVPVARLLEGEARFALDLLRQTRHLGMTLSFDKAGMNAECTVTPERGTRLDKITAACAERPVDLGLLHRLPTDGGVRGVLGVPSHALSEFLVGQIDDLVQEMNLNESVAKGIRELTALSAQAFGNSMAVNMYGRTNLFDGSFLVQTKDPDAVLKVYEQFARQMSEGALGEMYAALGQQWKFDIKRNARKIGEISVHRMVSRLVVEEGSELENLPPNMMELFTEKGLVFEFAEASEGRLIASMGAVELEKLLELSKAPVPTDRLGAAAAHGPGGFLYYDMDFGSVFASMSGFMEAEGIPTAALNELVEGLTGHPLTFAGHAKGGAMRMSMRLPSAIFAAFAVAGRAGAGAGAAAATPHQQAELDFEDLTWACDKFDLDHDRWPRSWEELLQKGSNGKPYLESMPLDPVTGKRYQVDWAAEDYGPVFIFYGSDGKPGGTGSARDLRSDED